MTSVRRRLADRFPPRFRPPGSARLTMIAVLACLAGWLATGALPLLLAVFAAPLLLAVRPGRVARRRGAAGVIAAGGARNVFAEALDDCLAEGARNRGGCAALILEIDDYKQLEERYERRSVDHILTIAAQRLAAVLRQEDVVTRLEGPTFGVALAPMRRFDLELAIQLSTRVQTALAEPVNLDGINAHLTVSIGFALAERIEQPSGERMLQAATLAMIEAQRSGPAAIRSYSQAMKDRVLSRNALARSVGSALENGEIGPYYQPQVSTSTGRITGVETLARWNSPERGLIPPIEFLPALEQAGLMSQLGQIMLDAALSTLRHWDALGLEVPRIAVNFSTEELRDPHLVTRIAGQLAQHGVLAERLVIEVLETVVAHRAEDLVIRNLAGLADLGCCLDLDDFGTGHASITTIRRFSIQRIKIDRSFVTGVDADPEQQQMVCAILTMAERLGLDTLAEGVETDEERRMLDELGCGHLQGYGIARPMPLEEADAWIAARQGRDGALVPFVRRA